MIPNYEYKVEKLDDEDLDTLERKLNLLGQDGWKMINFDGETAIFMKPQLYLCNTHTEASRPRTQLAGTYPENKL